MQLVELHLGPELQRVRSIRSVTATRTATEPASPEAAPTTTPLAPDVASHEPDPDLGAWFRPEPHPIVVVSRQGNLELVAERWPVVPDGDLQPASNRQRQPTSIQIAGTHQLDLPPPLEG